MSELVFLCQRRDIEDGCSLGLLPNQRGRDQLVAVRKGAVVHVYVNRCPHYGNSRLGWKKHQFLNGDRSRIMCAAHGALFRIEDGSCVSGPCLGQSLKRVPILVYNGGIYVKADALSVTSGRNSRHDRAG